MQNSDANMQKCSPKESGFHSEHATDSVGFRCTDAELNKLNDAAMHGHVSHISFACADAPLACRLINSKENPK
jgi:hypothetical protein